MLKRLLTNDEYDKADEGIQNLYKKTDDGYEIQVEGMVSKDKLNEFRENNVDLLKFKDQYKNIDLSELKELQEQKRKLLDADFINKKDFEGLVESRTNAMKSDYDAKIAALSGDLDTGKLNYNTMIAKHEIEGAANSAFTKHKISPDAVSAVMAQVKAKFSIDNGSVVAKDGDNIELGANGNLTVDEFVSSMPEIFKIQSSGGGGKGSETRHVSSENTTGLSKITEGLKAMRG